MFRMFQTHPETLQYFPEFSDLDSAEKQRNSETFKNHGEKVGEYTKDQGQSQLKSMVYQWREVIC